MGLSFFFFSPQRKGEIDNRQGRDADYDKRAGQEIKECCRER